jgi:hypothetical protein
MTGSSGAILVRDGCRGGSGHSTSEFRNFLLTDKLELFKFTLPKEAPVPAMAPAAAAPKGPWTLADRAGCRYVPKQERHYGQMFPKESA